MTRAGVALVILWLAGGRVAAQRLVSISALAGSEEHRLKDQLGSVTTSGFVPGAAVGLALGSRWELQLTARSGSLGASTRSSDDEEVAEVSALARFALTPWGGIGLTGATRSATTQLVRQHWTTVAVSGDLRLALIGSATEGYLRFGFPVLARVSGLPSPDVALDGEAGLHYRAGRVTGRLSYDLQRRDFSSVGGGGRFEQISTLTLGVGLLFEP